MPPLKALPFGCASWALPDCEHDPGKWWRDPTRVNLTVFTPERKPLSYCTTKCKRCKKSLYGLFTVRGDVVANFGAAYGPGKDDKPPRNIRR